MQSIQQQPPATHLPAAAAAPPDRSHSPHTSCPAALGSHTASLTRQPVERAPHSFPHRGSLSSSGTPQRAPRFLLDVQAAPPPPARTSRRGSFSVGGSQLTPASGGCATRAPTFISGCGSVSQGRTAPALAAANSCLAVGAAHPPLTAQPQPLQLQTSSPPCPAVCSELLRAAQSCSQSPGVEELLEQLRLHAATQLDLVKQVGGRAGCGHAQFCICSMIMPEGVSTQAHKHVS